MRFRLRTLLILMAILPPFLAWAWVSYRAAIREFHRRAVHTPMASELIAISPESAIRIRTLEATAVQKASPDEN